jgi:hypothetical protein
LTKELVKSMMNINLELKGSGVCACCEFGKAHRQSIPKVTSNHPNRPLELIHSDVGGPLPVQSHGHANYYVLFIDDFTRYTQVYCIKSKEEVLSKFIEFVAASELHFLEQGYKVKALRCDSGTEYLNKSFYAYTASKGIEMQPSPPYTHECNGVCERCNRTLMEAVRCMLFDAGLPPSFWAEAILTAVYVRNRCFASKIKRPDTPWSMWWAQPNDLSNLRVFGSLVYVYVERQDRTKLQAKAATGVFVGYTADKLSYRVWLHSAKAVHVTRHLTFDETKQGWKHHNAVIPTPLLTTPVARFSATNNALDHAPQPTTVDRGEPAAVNSEPRRSTRAHVPTKPHWHTHPEHHQSLYSYSTVLNASVEFTAMQSDSTATSSSEASLSIEPSEIAEICSEPVTLAQAMRASDWSQWKQAIEAELTSLHKAKVWVLVDPPTGCNIVGCKPVFKLKRGADGLVNRYKVRYVAQGYSQVFGMDFTETFAPVAKSASIKALLALAAWHSLHVHQMDVETAFLNGDIDHTIYMQQPAGSVRPGNEHKVCLLKKSIYGLKQSGRMWYQKMDDALTREHGFEAMQGDHCIYRRDDPSSGSVLWIALYVDDLLIMGNLLHSLNAFKGQLATTFAMKDIGPAQYILGIQIHRDSNTGALTINQSTYIKGLVSKFNMSNSRPISTPMEVKHGLCHSQSPVDRLGREAMRSTPYLSAVGGLMYAMTCTRPDLAYAVTTLSQFGNNPGSAHWTAVKRVLQYLNCTSDMGITYQAKPKHSNEKAVLYGYADADWASNPDNRRSITGFAFVLGGGIVSWSARRQPTVALSTVEAEYMAYCMAAKEAIWWRQLLSQLYYWPINHSTKSLKQLPATIIFADNQGAIALAHNPEFHQRTKHISIIYHFIREKIITKELAIRYLSTQNMAADFLTKSLPRDGLNKCCSMLGIGSPPVCSSGSVADQRTHSA